MIYSKEKKIPTILSEDEQDRDEEQLFGFALHKDTTKIEETRVKT